MKIGPVKARWKGKVKLSDLDPPNGYKITGKARAALPDLPRAARRSLSPTRTAAPCLNTMSTPRLAVSSPNSASA